jgi:hypothetical protein
VELSDNGGTNALPMFADATSNTDETSYRAIGVCVAFFTRVVNVHYREALKGHSRSAPTSQTHSPIISKLNT